MRPGLFSFLEKVSASIDQLQAGMRRLKPIRVPTAGRIGREAGAGISVPNVKSQVVHSYLSGKGPQRNPLGAQSNGQILLPRGGSAPALANAGVPGFQNLSGDGKRAVNVSVGLHEGFERGVKPTQAAPMREGHASPNVLLNEHNMLSKMTGPGADEARTAMRGMREQSGEEAKIRKMFENRYGPRSAQFLQEGQKVPAAMRRNFAAANHAAAKADAHAEWAPMFEGALAANPNVPAEWAPYLRFHNKKLAAPQAQPQHQEFLDEHFSLSPQWKSFKGKLKSKTFVEAVDQDTRADDKLKRFSKETGRHMQARGVPTFKIPGSGRNTYTVKYHPDADRFSCNCGDWTYKRSHQLRRPNQDCKHVQRVKTELREEGKSERDLIKSAALARAALVLSVKTTLAP